MNHRIFNFASIKINKHNSFIKIKTKSLKICPALRAGLVFSSIYHQLYVHFFRRGLRPRTPDLLFS